MANPQQPQPRKAIPPELTEALADLNAATNEVAATVDTLRAQIKNQMTPAEVQQVQQGLADVSGRLRGMAADPNNPVPPPA